MSDIVSAILTAWPGARVKPIGRIAVNPTPQEIEAMLAASPAGGAYLEKLGKTDMATMTEDEWMGLTEAIVAQGYPVFPCNADKKPLTEHGFKDASSDPAMIRTMFANPAAVMIGVPTGVITGLVVVDVDVKENRQGMDWLNANSHRMPQT